MTRESAVSLRFDGQNGLAVDVAVVGAGVAGLYAAWRLARAPGINGGRPSVAVLEATERIGGRIETATFPGLNSHRAEFGAMRLASWQRLVLSLVEELRLPLEPFPEGTDRNFWFLRGRQLHAEDLTGPDVPYWLAEDERGRSPQALLDIVANRLLGATPIPTDRRGWDELKSSLRYRGRPAREFGFWNVLTDHLSSEAVHFVEDAVGFGSMTQNWNAIEALQLIYADFGSDVHFVRIAGGSDRLPVALARGFTARGGTIFAGNPVIRVDADGSDGTLLLTIRNRRSRAAWQLRARRVIFALPRRALELLGQAGSLFEPYPIADPELLGLVGSVHRFPAFKLFLAYEQPWWRELGITGGRSVTDLPIRQTFYFGVEDDERALLMGSYDDDRTVSYWQGLGWTEAAEANAPRLETEGEGGVSEVLVAPPEMIRHAQRQLERMHGVEIPAPYMAAYRNWGRAPYGGAWHLWRVNADSVAITRRMRRPMPRYDVHVCGEAYSGIQGFIEGALTSTELVLQEQLGLGPPAWLEPGYYLGPD